MSECNTRTNEQELKDHEIAQIVNNLRDIAVQYHNYECLREKIAGVIVPALKGVSKMNELKKCLKCSDEMEVVKASNGFHYLRCVNCMLQFGDEDNVFKTRKEAAVAWNTCITPSITRERLVDILNNYRFRKESIGFIRYPLMDEEDEAFMSSKAQNELADVILSELKGE